MAAEDLATLLAGVSTNKMYDPDRFVERNPYYSTGTALRQMSLGNNYPNTWQGALARVLTGVLGGGLSGYGERKGLEEFENYLPQAFAIEQQRREQKAAQELEQIADKMRTESATATELLPQTLANKEAEIKMEAPYKERAAAAGRTEIKLPAQDDAAKMVLEARVEASKGINRAKTVLSVLDQLDEEETIGGAIIRNVIAGIDPATIEGQLTRAQDKAVFASLKPLFPGQLSDAERNAMQKAMGNKINMTVGGLKQVYRGLITESAAQANVPLREAKIGGYEVGKRYQPLSENWADYYKPETSLSSRLPGESYSAWKQRIGK